MIVSLIGHDTKNPFTSVTAPHPFSSRVAYIRTGRFQPMSVKGVSVTLETLITYIKVVWGSTLGTVVRVAVTFFVRSTVVWSVTDVTFPSWFTFFVELSCVTFYERVDVSWVGVDDWFLFLCHLSTGWFEMMIQILNCDESAVLVYNYVLIQH